LPQKVVLGCTPKARGNAAPKARNIKARGKREARRPWYTNQTHPALKGRNISALQA